MSTAPNASSAPSPAASAHSPQPGHASRAFVLDLVALLVFALLARLAHDDGSGFSVLRWLDTAWPFMVGTVVVWVVLRLSGKPAGQDFRTGTIVWLGSLVAGLGIWGIRHQAVPHWSFILVATIMSAILLFGWRGIARARAGKK